MDLPMLSTLNCPVCHEILNDPKLLECGHTFCLKCIKNILQKDAIKCPLCRSITPFDKGDLSKLRTNILACSIIDDLKQNVKCTATTERNHNESAEFYCHDCGVFFCKKCGRTHHAWEPNRKHRVSTVHQYKKTQYQHAVEKPSSGTVESTKPETSICVQCNKVLSSRMANYHKSKKHDIVAESTYLLKTKKKAWAIQKDITDTIGKIQTSRTIYSEHESLVRSHSYDIISEINQTYASAIKRLDDWKLEQTKLCQKLQENVSKSYDKLDREMSDDIHKLLGESRLLNRSLVNSENITACGKLCDEFSNTLSKLNRKARNIELERQTSLAINMSNNGHFLLTGGIRVDNWDVSYIPLKENQNMTSIAVNMQRETVVSFLESGVVFHNKESVNYCLTGTKVLGIAFLSDGHAVLRDAENEIKLFGTGMALLPNKFRTLSITEGGLGGLAVDRRDNIYVSYRAKKIIQMFNRGGGHAVKQIACGIYTPQQITVISKEQLLVMDGQVISLLNDAGTRMHEIKYSGCEGYPTVSSDGFVLIAWVDRRIGILRIDKYSKELKLIKCIFSSNVLDLSGRKWYCLREIPHEGFAFCTSRYLVTLKQRVSDNVSSYLEGKTHMLSTTV